MTTVAGVTTVVSIAAHAIPASSSLPANARSSPKLASGATNREIVGRLGISAKTIMHHSAAIYRKLAVRGRCGATARADEVGLVRRRPGGTA